MESQNLGGFTNLARGTKLDLSGTSLGAWHSDGGKEMTPNISGIHMDGCHAACLQLNLCYGHADARFAPIERVRHKLQLEIAPHLPRTFSIQPLMRLHCDKAGLDENANACVVNSACLGPAFDKVLDAPRRQ